MVLSSFLRPSLLPAVLSHSLHLPDSPSSGSIKSLLICSFLLIWIHTGPNCWLGSAKETRLNEVHKTHQQSLAVCVWPFRPGVRVYRCFHTHYAALFFTDYYFNLHRRSLSRTFTPHFHTVLLSFPFFTLLLVASSSSSSVPRSWTRFLNPPHLQVLQQQVLLNTHHLGHTYWFLCFVSTTHSH